MILLVHAGEAVGTSGAAHPAITKWLERGTTEAGLGADAGGRGMEGGSLGGAPGWASQPGKWWQGTGDMQHPEGPWRCALPGAEVEKEEHFPLYPPPPRRGEEPLAVCYRPPFLPRLFLSRFFTRQATPGSLGFFFVFCPSAFQVVQ